MSPSNQERLFQKSYSADLLSIARMDLKTAEYLRGGAEEADEALRMGQSAIDWAESVLTGSN